MKIDYFLPVSRAHLSGSVTTVSYGPGTDGREVIAQVAVSHAFELVTVADPARPRRLTVEPGLWQDYALDLGLTEDGRLVSFGLDSAGQAGKVLTAGVTAAAAVAALAIGQLPAAAALAVAATRAIDQVLGETAPVPALAPAGAGGPAWQAYTRAYPARAERAAQLLQQREAALTALSAARAGLIAAIADPAGRRDRGDQITALGNLVSGLDHDLAGLTEHFAAWHAALPRIVHGYDELLALSELPRLVSGALEFGPADARPLARAFYEKVGWMLATVGDPGAPAAQQGRKEAAALYLLRPCPLRLAWVQRTGGREVVTGYDDVLVMSGQSEELELPLVRSRNGKRTLSARLSPIGALTGITSGRVSAAADDARTVAATALPAAIGHCRDLTDPEHADSVKPDRQRPA